MERTHKLSKDCRVWIGRGTKPIRGGSYPSCRVKHVSGVNLEASFSGLKVPTETYDLRTTTVHIEQCFPESFPSANVCKPQEEFHLTGKNWVTYKIVPAETDKVYLHFSLIDSSVLTPEELRKMFSLPSSEKTSCAYIPVARYIKAVGNEPSCDGFVVENCRSQDNFPANNLIGIFHNPEKDRTIILSRENGSKAVHTHTYRLSKIRAIRKRAPQVDPDII